MSYLNVSQPASTLLRAANGSDTSVGATNVDTVAISGLTALDTLLIYATLESITQQTAAVTIYNVTDSVKLSEASQNAAITAAGFSEGMNTVRQAQNASTHVIGMAYNVVNTATNFAGFRTDATVTTAWTGAWTLALRHGGVTAGGTFRWNWAVYKVLGQ